VTGLDVRVFTFELDQPTDVVERLDALLAPDEHDARTPIRVGRAAARIVLADALDLDPARVPISRRCAHCGHATHGRPTVTGGAAISFSLSHSGAFGVVAVADGDVRVGVDVEEVRPRGHLDALAARVLNDEEHAAWLALDDADDRLRAFLRAWTEKEAYVKALGTGIATPLREVPPQVEGWRRCALDLGADRVAALAVDRAEVGVRLQRVALAPLATSNGGTAG
jgi:4'-phosphopantetheinyl transferase